MTRNYQPSDSQSVSTFRTLRLLSIGLLVTSMTLSLTGCVSTFSGPSDKAAIAESSTETKPVGATNETNSTDSEFNQVAGASGLVPACLNVVENDLRVEFDKSRLILQDGKKPRALSLDNGEQVRCEQLRILEKTKRPSVEIVYLTREAGTSINIVERRMAIASIRDGKWIAKPMVIDRLFSEGDEIKSVPVMEVKWSEDKGKLVLTRTDIVSKESETIRP